MQKMIAKFGVLADFAAARGRWTNRLPNPARIEGLENRLMLIASPFLVKDISPGASSSNPAQITAAGTLAFFVASPASNDQQLFASDGTSMGTVQLTNVSQAGGANPNDLTNVNGTLFFAANDAAHGTELWKSNGSAGGTAIVKDIAAGSGSSNPHGMVAFENELYFVANAGNGEQIWKSDGTAAGTVQVTAINPGAATAFDDLVVQGSTLYFFGDDAIHGPALWKSDGTAAGTSMVVATGTAIGGGGVGQLSAANGQLFFVATDPTNGYQVWRSDGTAAGTHPVKIIDPGITLPAFAPQSLTTIGNIAYFAANDGTGFQLWSSDGTAAGTSVVKAINPGGAASPTGLTNVNGALFFAANDGTDGVELWQSDGTASGTILTTDINPGSGSSDPSGLINTNGVLFFNASDGTHGSQLWENLGPPAETQPLAIINPSGNAFDNTNGHNLMATANGTLFFDASNGTSGQELWAIKTGAPALSPTSTTIVSSQLNAVGGNSVRFTATVTSAGSPTGNVIFLDGGMQIGSVALGLNGSSTFATSILGAGSHSISAEYSGDGIFAPSASLAITETVAPGAASSTSITSSANPGVQNAAIQLTATITGAGTPTGSVNFLDGATVIGSAMLDSSDMASITVSTLTLGAHSITAQYMGDGIFGPSVSSVLAQTIIPGAASQVAITSSENPGIAGDTIQFNAAVTSAGAGVVTPSGNVEFFDGATSLGTALLFPNGQISFASSTLSVGTHTITAQYQGDGVYSASISAPLTQTIVPPTPANLVPSLTTAGGAIPGSVIGGAKLRRPIPILVTNPSNAAIKETITIALYATTSPTSITGGTMIGTLTQKVSLKPGKSIKLRIKAPLIPASLPNGTYNIVAQLTDPNSHTLLAANPATVQVAAPFISPAATLGAVAPASIAPGKHGSITLTIANSGNIAAVGTMTVQINPSTDGQTALAGETLISVTKHVSIKPGGSLKLKLRLTIPSALAPGQYVPLASLIINGIAANAVGPAFAVT